MGSLERTNMLSMFIEGITYHLDTQRDINYLSELSDKKNTVGVADITDQIIYVAKDQPQEEKKKTWLHEIIEVVNDSNKLGLNEDKICKLEKALYSTLKDRISFPEFN